MRINTGTMVEKRGFLILCLNTRIPAYAPVVRRMQGSPDFVQVSDTLHASPFLSEYCECNCIDYKVGNEQCKSHYLSWLNVQVISDSGNIRDLNIPAAFKRGFSYLICVMSFTVYLLFYLQLLRFLFHRT